MPTARLAPLIGVALLLATQAVGWCCLIRFSLAPMWRWREAAAWTPVACAIESIEDRRAGWGTKTHHRSSVRYRYVVAGVDYIGDRVDFFPGEYAAFSTSRLLSAENRVAVCYVDPAAPQRSVLERGWSKRYLTGWFGAVFILPPLALLARRRSAAVTAGTRAG